MEPMEAAMVLILTVLLMFIVLSPATWSSPAARDGDGELYGHPSSCISTSLDFVFSPSPACSPYSLFEDDSASCNNNNNNDDSSSLAGAIAVPSNASGEPEQVPVVDDPVPPSAVPESG